MKLRNKYKFQSRKGDYVRVDPKDPGAFEYVPVTSMPIIGIVAESKPPGQKVEITLLGEAVAAAPILTKAAIEAVFTGVISTHSHTGSGLTIQQVKADTEIASAISLRHASGSDNQDLSGLQPRETGKGLYPNTDAAKLAGIEAGANNYVHPANHPASVITQDSNNRFVSDTEKTTWNGKQDALGFTPAAENHTHIGVYESANANIQAHVTSAHAPSNAQKNSDITKGEIEARLTGEITTHSHPGGGSVPISWGKYF